MFESEEIKSIFFNDLSNKNAYVFGWFEKQSWKLDHE